LGFLFRSKAAGNIWRGEVGIGGRRLGLARGPRGVRRVRLKDGWPNCTAHQLDYEAQTTREKGILFFFIFFILQKYTIISKFSKTNLPPPWTIDAGGVKSNKKSSNN
jgi:hypothetical protein